MRIQDRKIREWVRVRAGVSVDKAKVVTDGLSRALRIVTTMFVHLALNANGAGLHLTKNVAGLSSC